MSKTALLFAGQGAQTVGMGKSFMDQFPSAKTIFEAANRTLGYDLASICFNGPEKELTKTENAQPAIFLVSWVAFQMLRERVPTLRFGATAGLSLGEFTALAAAEAMSFEDGLEIVRKRGVYMQEACEVTQGSMAAVIGMEEEALRNICKDADVELANLNCPGQLVVSGESSKVTRACELAKERGAKRVLPLAVAGAYHSRLMKSAGPKLEKALSQVTIHTPTVPVVSNVNAKPHGEPPEIKNLLVDQVTSSVLWEASMSSLLAEGFDCFIELGPGSALSSFMKRIDKGAKVLNVADVATLNYTVKELATGDLEPQE